MPQPRFAPFRFSTFSQIIWLASLVLVASCTPGGRGGGGDDDDDNDSCFTDVDCTTGEEYCKADDPSSSPRGVCTALEPAGGSCIWGSQCSGDLFCLVDNSENEGNCRAAPSSCDDGPACNCEPMLEMCAPGGLSCDGSDDSVTLHCNNGIVGSLGDDDDDDATSDDDDTSSDDDDGTGTMDVDAITFVFEMTANPGAGGTTGIAATFRFSYWSDVVNQILNCEQSVSIEGTASFAGGAVSGCANCTGRIDFDDSTAADVSAGSDSSSPCSAASLDAADANFGIALLSTITNSGYGDFLSIGLIDASTMSSLGLDLASAGGYSAADISTALSGVGLTFTHAGYISNEVGSLSDVSSLSIPAATAGSGSSWYGYWQIFVDPALNSHTGIDMSGPYSAQAVWQVGFNQQ